MTDPAQPRFFAIQIVRLLGVALVLGGILLQAGRIAPLRDVPPEVGYILIAVGIADVFIMPLVLARRWRTPKP